MAIFVLIFAAESAPLNSSVQTCGRWCIRSYKVSRPFLPWLNQSEEEKILYVRNSFGKSKVTVLQCVLVPILHAVG